MDCTFWCLLITIVRRRVGFEPDIAVLRVERSVDQASRAPLVKIKVLNLTNFISFKNTFQLE